MSTPDLSEFVRLSKPRKKQCGVGEIAKQLSKKEGEQLLAAIVATDGGGITVSAVIEWCKQRGHEVSQNTVVHHRRGRCRCDAVS